CLRLQRFKIYARFDLLLYFALIIRYIAGSSRSLLFTDTVQNPGEGSLMSSRNHNGTPAYQRIQSAIRQRIKKGELKPGDPVSSERELAKAHEVSLMTARHALAGLEREGIVSRRPGAGTFVAPPRIHFNKLMSYTEQMAGRGLAASSTVILARIIEAEHEIAARLSLPASANLVKIERVRHSADEPFAFETCYLPSDEFPGLLK